ncbi:crotonase/enoyl-CoA hydratase family protein [Yinghuangia sp. YIM S09857]|uniref:crotonase/enoyl-CoA hydratase family protein n=1 Tax=Yinghuangia sp. YIM S09857 TaxID=3436929 RepID=UPI003F53A854
MTVERTDRVMLITLNRPHARNAVTAAVSALVAAAIDEFEDRDDLEVAVVTGAGGAFCAGMDLRAFADGEHAFHPRRGFAGIAGLPPSKPVIAAVEGYALAGGFEIVLACDLVVAADDARFGLPEVKRGLIAAAGGLLRLPRRVPEAVALELALTGDPLPAADALRLGLVNRLTEPGKALEGALGLAQRIIANEPRAVAVSKQIVTQLASLPIEEAFTHQDPLAAPILASADAREGALAFVERRTPAWQDR